MDIDFALVLVVVTGTCLAIFLLDKFVLAPKRKPEQAQPVVVEYARSFLPVFALVLVLRSFVFEPFQIPSGSMIPTLKIGDFILVNKFNYGLRLPVVGTTIVPLGKPERGDVMVFYPPNDSRYFIKRVIGLPGDHIKIVNKVLFINGVEAEQTLVRGINDDLSYEILDEQLGDRVHKIRKQRYKTSWDNMSVVVKPGHYFMMGDNRDNSSDSRRWGQVPENNIVGQAVAVWMTWESFFSLPTFERVGTIN